MNNLQSITLGITQRCNLRCIWCFQNSSPSNDIATTEPPLPQIFEIIDLISPYTTRITLTGGEPFIRSDIKSIFNYCIEKGVTVSVTTNSLLISEAMMTYLVSNKVGVIVSIDGLAEKHDKIRGAGSFKKAMDKVSQMKTLGMNIALQMTVSKYNIEDLPEIILIAEKMGVLFAIQRMIPFGRGAEFKDWTLSPNDIQKIKIIIDESKYNRIHSKEVLHRPESDKVIDLMQRYPNCIVGGCKVGMGYVYVDIYGNVYGCPFLPYELGNVFSQKNIIEILESSDLIKKIRCQNQYTGNCSNCRWWYACRGCRATANVYGDVMGDDPLCWYTP